MSKVSFILRNPSDSFKYGLFKIFGVGLENARFVRILYRAERIAEHIGANPKDAKNHLRYLFEKKDFLNYIEASLKPYRHLILGFVDIWMQVLLLYTVMRLLKPSIVVETGVASGISTSFILLALEHNQYGSLYSIDLPTYMIPQHYKIIDQVTVPEGKAIGWIVPDNLRHRWNLITGKSSENLKPLLERLSSVDIFIHDSEHTYENMMFEFETAWKFLNKNGLLISHDVNWNNAFSDFTNSTPNKSLIIDSLLGFAIKL